MFTDPIADMIVRIRNASMRNKPEVIVPHSRLKASVLDALVREGFVDGYEEIQEENRVSHKNLKVRLKYFSGKPVIQEMRRISKPSLHVYTPVDRMGFVANGLGSAILSTSAGILSDREARDQRVGGKILLTVR